MKLSKLFMTTLRELPSDAEIPSHRLMLRASLMRQVASGVYAYLPLGYRVIRKIEEIVREEMDKTQAQEVLMSALVSSDIYKQSGRWDIFGEEMFRLKDRNERDFCLGPTHEELFTDTVKASLSSYKSLPVTLYQIQTKYRDEKRPRFGVIRSREFIMKDAYSFDIGEEGLDVSYKSMYEAYCRIFDRLGLKYLIVDADSGAMGGSGSQEFMVINEIGEDQIVYCPECSYAANMEKASCNNKDVALAEASQDLSLVETPNMHTIEEVSGFFNCKSTEIAKTIIYSSDDKTIGVMVRGDREINETKLKNFLGSSELTLATFEIVEKVTGAEVGFAGPIGLDIPLYGDYEISYMDSFIAGGNKTDFHYMGMNAKRDIPEIVFSDFRNVVEGDACPKCNTKLQLTKGIEIGHIFKLGTKYTKALSCTYINDKGKEAVPIMGCYGIGVSRLMAAIIEQHHDTEGICWPYSVAPYHIIIIPIGSQGSESFDLAMKMYEELLSKNIQVLLDDRSERPGVKFKDSELIGIPIRVTVGRKANEGIVELKLRREETKTEMLCSEAISYIISEVL